MNFIFDICNIQPTLICKNQDTLMPKIQTLTQKGSKTIKHLKMTFWTNHGNSTQCVLQWIQLGLYSTFFFQYILQLQNEGLSKKQQQR